MPRFRLGGGGGGGEGGGGGGADTEILHDPSVVDPIPVIFVQPGIKEATTDTDTSAVQALTAGVFTVGGVSTAAIDFSGVPNGIAGINPIAALINDAIALVPGLDGYQAGISFNGATFSFVVRHFNGNVGVLSGAVITAMGLDAFNETAFSPKSDSLMIPPPSTGYWRELKFFSIFTIQRDFYCTSTARLVSDGTDTHSWLNATSNNGAWFQHQESNESSGLYTLSKATYYSFVYSDFSYNLATGELTWDNPVTIVPKVAEVYKMNSLLVTGVRGS